MSDRTLTTPLWCSVIPRVERLSAPGAVVVWTRQRDMTPLIRQQFDAAGLGEQAEGRKNTSQYRVDNLLTSDFARIQGCGPKGSRSLRLRAETREADATPATPTNSRRPPNGRKLGGSG
jgi:hypothetical protein